MEASAKRGVRVLREQEYELAERRIRETLRRADSTYRPHELVEQLSSEPGIPTDVASTTMWEMIGAGDIELSDDWYVSLVLNNHKTIS
jgi:hypothetical protein